MSRVKRKYMKFLIAAVSILSVFSVNAQSDGFKIVFNVLEDSKKDNYEIYSMNMDGSDRKNLTNTPGVEWVYYAYREKVYFISDKDTCHRCFFLYEMDTEGNNMRRISDLQLEDSWMSSRNNGREMIVLGRIGKTVRNQLFLLNPEDGTYRQLTNDTLINQRDPLFLPGKNEIVLAYRPDKRQRQTVPDELWKFNLVTGADGKPALNRGVQLTHFPASDTSTRWYEYHAGPPQWNSRYKFISYMSKQQGQTQIHAITRDGKKSWQLTANSELSSGWHSWSEDGKWLAMDRSTHEGKDFDIWLMNYRTKKMTRISTDSKSEMAPVIVRKPR